MTNINLRLYGEQLYPNISKYLSKYISPEIKKEDFVSMYKEGLVKVKDVDLKEEISINPQIKIKTSSIGELNLNIPNETENFMIQLNNMKTLLIISDIKEEEVESILLDNKKQLIENFISYAVKKIEKKDSKSFLDNLIKNVMNKILNGLTIEIKNLELKAQLNDQKNKNFTFLIEDINYSEQYGVKIKNISLLYEEDLMKLKVIDKFDFNIEIIKAKDNEQEKNKINISISDFKFELDRNIYFEFFKFFSVLEEAEYKKIYLKYKDLIQFHRPKELEGTKKNYAFYWYYAITTIVKLQKYIEHNNQDIFDLIDSTQIKIAKNYLSNDKNKKILCVEDKNILKVTKEKVEKKVLENKNGNSLKNAFSFFFGGGKQEEKKEELTEDEKKRSEELFKDENIINYLKGKRDDDSDANMISIFDKIKNFFSNISIDINIDKLELILQNINNKQNLFIRGIKLIFNYFNKQFHFKFLINDIGYDINKSFFDKSDITDSNVITLNRDINNFIQLDFGFKNVILNEDMFIAIFTFVQSIKTKKRYILFHEKKEKKNDNNEEIMKNLKNFSFMNNFKLSNIPSFSIKSDDNMIQVNILEYKLEENSIKFTINVKDSYGIILNDITFNQKKENNKFIFNLEQPLDIVLSNKASRSLFINYLTYKNRFPNNNNIDNKDINKNKEAELFRFNFTSKQNIDIGNFDINSYSLDILIKKISIKINEEDKNYQSFLVIDNFKILYEKKNLDISFEEIKISINLMSTMVLYLIDFESPLFKQYQDLIKSMNKDINDILSNNSNILEGENDKNKNNNDNIEIKNEINYSNLMKEIFNKINININSFSFILVANNLITSLNLNKIFAFKNDEKKALCIEFSNWYLDYKFNSKTKKIIENNQKTFVKFEFDTEILKGKMKHININTDLKEVMDIWENLSFLILQINFDIILCKMKFDAEDFILLFDKFRYNISKILFSNFQEDNIKNDTFYFKFYDFLITNQNENKIIYQKEFNVDYIMETSIDNTVKINFPDINIQLSQQDILFLLLSIKPPEEKKKG